MKRLWIALICLFAVAGCESAAERAAQTLRQGGDGYIYAGFGVVIGGGLFGPAVTPGTAILAKVDGSAGGDGDRVRLPSKSNGSRLGRFVAPGRYRLVGLEITVGEDTRQVQVPDSETVSVGEREVVDLGRYEIHPGAGETWVLKNQSLFAWYRDALIKKTPEIGLRLVHRPLYP